MVPVTGAISNLAEAFSFACMQLVRPVMYSLSTVFGSISSGFLPGSQQSGQIKGQEDILKRRKILGHSVLWQP